jgi:heme/copper-type cytochrome/quinol oxidase subunit 2
MRKITIIEIAIIISTSVIVFALAFTGQSSYSGYQTIDWNNASRALTFDLQTGQSVSGSLTYTGDTSGTWFTVYNPDGNPLVASPTYYEYQQKRVIFSFTASTDGEYYASVGHNKPWTVFINYEYTISPSPILGVDRTVLTGMVITIGVVLALTIAVWDLRRTRIKKEDKSTN